MVERSEKGRFCGMDMCAIGSKVLADGGIEIDPLEAARLMYAASQQTANYNLIRTWATQTAAVIDYITDLCAEYDTTVEPSTGGTSKAGWDTMPERYVVFQDAVRFSSAEFGIFRTDGLEPHQNLGDVLIASATENGCQFFFNTHAEQLVGSAADGVTGVVATDAEGNHIQFNAAKGVVLCTGDISGNQEMVDCWAPIANRADESAYLPIGANTGDAILMTKWIGGGISKSPAAPMIHQFTIATRSYNMTPFFLSMLAVNSDGERFMNEMPFEPFITDARMNSKGNIAWSIFDGAYATYVEKQFPQGYETMLETIPGEIEERLENGTLVSADTLEELAEKIGVPTEAFVASVEAYNAACDAGVDSQFGVVEQMLYPLTTAPYLRHAHLRLEPRRRLRRPRERRLPGLHRRRPAHRGPLRRRQQPGRLLRLQLPGALPRLLHRPLAGLRPAHRRGPRQGHRDQRDARDQAAGGPTPTRRPAAHRHADRPGSLQKGAIP